MIAPLWAGNALAWAAQVAVVAGAALLLPRLLRLRQPRLLLALGQGVLFLVLLLPLVQPRHAPAAGVLPFVAVAGEGAAAVPPALGVSWRAAAWLLGGATAARLVWMGVGLAWLARLRRTARPPAARPAGWEELCARIGTAPPELLVSDRVPGPVSFGIRRPVVVLPESFERADAATARAILCHEALHVRRRDWAAAVAEETVRALFWFHPVVGRLVARIRLWREQVVDASAVALTGDRGGYLQALLHAAAARPPLPLPAASFLHRNDLGQRVALLVEEKPMNQRRLVLSAAAVALGLAAAGALSIAVLPLRAAEAAKGGEITLPKIVEKTDAEYPAELRKEKLEGEVVLRILVDETGRVASAEVDESPHRAFSESAREAVRTWRFEPGRVDGKVAPVELTLTIRYVLEKSDK